MMGKVPLEGTCQGTESPKQLSRGGGGGIPSKMPPRGTTSHNPEHHGKHFVPIKRVRSQFSEFPVGENDKVDEGRRKAAGVLMVLTQCTTVKPKAGVYS